MKAEKIDSLLKDFENAISRLQDGINVESEDDIVIDGVIQRFEFSFELAWKLMKSYLYEQGIICNSPRQSIKEAFKIGLLEDGNAWLDMLMDRNKTTHIYDENEANAIFEKIIEKHLLQLNSFLIQIKTEIQNLSS